MNIENKQSAKIEETIENKAITLTFTLKKLTIISTGFITFLTSTISPFIYTQYQKKIDIVKNELKFQYEFELKEAKYHAAEAAKVKQHFVEIVSQLESSIAFLKLHTRYNTCYIVYMEKPNITNKQRYDDAVIAYAQLIKNKKTTANTVEDGSFYLSDEIIYVDGYKYTIPYDVLNAVRDLKGVSNAD